MTMNAHKEKWLENQASIWQSTKGQTISRVYAVREPLDWRDEEGTEPIYAHHSVRFHHLAKLWMVLSNERTLNISTSEDDDVFGVFVSDNGTVDKSDERVIEIDCSGVIKNVRLKIEKDNVAEVWLTVDEDTKIIASGEVEPGWDGYIIRKLDESVLLFESQYDFDKTVFGKSHKLNLKEN